MSNVYGPAIITDSQLILPLSTGLQEYIDLFHIPTDNLGICVKADEAQTLFEPYEDTLAIIIQRNLDTEREIRDGGEDNNFPIWLYTDGMTYISTELAELQKKATLYKMGFMPEEFSPRMKNLSKYVSKEYYRFGFGRRFDKELFLENICMKVFPKEKRCVVNIMKLQFINNFAMQRMFIPTSYFGTEDFVERYLEAYYSCRSHIDQNLPQLLPAHEYSSGFSQDIYTANRDNYPLDVSSSKSRWRSYKKLCLPDIEIV